MTYGNTAASTVYVWFVIGAKFQENDRVRYTAYGQFESPNIRGFVTDVRTLEPASPGFAGRYQYRVGFDKPEGATLRAYGWRKNGSRRSGLWSSWPNVERGEHGEGPFQARRQSSVHAPHGEVPRHRDGGVRRQVHRVDEILLQGRLGC